MQSKHEKLDWICKMRIPDIDIETSRKEYDALPSNEWRKDYFNEENISEMVRKNIHGHYYLIDADIVHSF